MLILNQKFTQIKKNKNRIRSSDESFKIIKKENFHYLDLSPQTLQATNGFELADKESALAKLLFAELPFVELFIGLVLSLELFKFDGCDC